MVNILLLLLGVAVGNAYYLSDEKLDEERQIGNCYGDKPYECPSLNGSICISYEGQCDHFSHCQQNTDEGANCVFRHRKEVKTLLHAYKRLVGELGHGNQLLWNIFGKARIPFNEILGNFQAWNFPVEYSYLEQFYHDYLPQTLHRTLLYSDSDDPKMFAAYLSTQPGMLAGWNNYVALQGVINNKVQANFQSLVSGGYFNSLK